jgi:hypothetical protein
LVSAAKGAAAARRANVQYLFLIYSDEARDASMSETEMQALFEAHGAFARTAAERGATIVAGEALQPTATATTVRHRDGEALITDGPFAETKEALGGFYLVECADLDAALALARECPSPNGCVEVRPIMTFS